MRYLIHLNLSLLHVLVPVCVLLCLPDTLVDRLAATFSRSGPEVRLVNFLERLARARDGEEMIESDVDDLCGQDRG